MQQANIYWALSTCQVLFALYKILSLLNPHNKLSPIFYPHLPDKKTKAQKYNLVQLAQVPE